MLAERGEQKILSTQFSISDYAEILSSYLRYNSATKEWRLLVRAQIHVPNKVVEIRAALVDENQHALLKI